MQRQETSSQIVMGPQLFKDTLYGDARNRLAHHLLHPQPPTPSGFPSPNAVPALDLEQNCYLGIGIRTTALPGNGQSDAARTGDIIAIPGLWLDLDYRQPRRPQGAASAAADRRRSTDALLDAAPYKPSLIVHSGHGLQVYWLFKEIACFDT